MVTLYYGFVVLVVMSCKCSVCQSLFCPVSLSINRSHGYFGYPSDIYDRERFLSQPQQLYFNCTTESEIELTKGSKYEITNSFGEKQFVHYCENPSELSSSSSSLSSCPVRKENLHAFLSNEYSSPPIHALCPVLDALGMLPVTVSKTSPNKGEGVVNIIILGGSVTTGVGAEGCCCKDDARCSGRYEEYCVKDVYNNLNVNYALYEGNKACSWSGYFFRWLESYVKAKGVNVRLLNLAERGYTSMHMFEGLTEKLRKHKVVLTSSDLIFLDHSCNDDAFFNFAHTFVAAAKGVENLVYKLFSLSKNAHQTPPAIVILETWPQYFRFHASTENKHAQLNINKATGGDHISDYSIVYRRVAKHFGIPIWSFRELAWDAFSIDHQSDFSLYLRNSFEFGSSHPSWPVHLFTADVIASTLLQAAQNCTQKPGKDWWNLRAVNDSIEPLGAIAIDFKCDLDKIAVEISARSVLLNSGVRSSSPNNIGKKWNVGGGNITLTNSVVSVPISTSSSISSSSSSSWFLAEDVRGRFGWISTLDVGEAMGKREESEEDRNKSHTLQFALSPSLFTNPRNFFIRIVYMRTYKSAGMVDVFLCGTFLQTLDALWPDHSVFRVSTPEVFSYRYLHRINSSECSPSPTPREEVQPLSPSTRTRTKSFKYSIDFIHRPAKDSHAVARRNEKFKIIELLVC